MLSTAWGILRGRAISEIAAMSVSFSVGLAGVSVKMSRVVSRTAAPPRPDRQCRRT